MEAAAQGEFPVLKSRIGILDTIVTLAPLLGLLGTVVGMIGSFDVMADGGIGQPHAEGVGRAVAFSLALASRAVAGEPEKKEDTFNLPPVVVQDQGASYVAPESTFSKFPVPLQDTPQSVTILPEKLIQEQAGTTLRDALRNVPGITATAGEGGGNQGDVFTIRGFNARNDTFIDGVRDSGSYFRDSSILNPSRC